MYSVRWGGGGIQCYDCSWKIPPPIPSPLSSNYMPERGFRTLAAKSSGGEKTMVWWKGQKEEKVKLLYLKIPTIISYRKLNKNRDPQVESFVLWTGDALSASSVLQKFLNFFLSGELFFFFLNQNDVKNSICRTDKAELYCLTWCGLEAHTLSFSLKCPSISMQHLHGTSALCGIQFEKQLVYSNPLL